MRIHLVAACVLLLTVTLSSAIVSASAIVDPFGEPAAIDPTLQVVSRNMPITPLPANQTYTITDAYVLGISSGGFLAVQMHVAYSSEFTGAAIFTAGPWYCAQNSIETAMESCMNTFQAINLPELESTASGLESQGLLDGLTNLTSQPVYLFHGTSDTTVYPAVNQALYQMYLDYGANVFFNNGTAAGHCWCSPTGPVPCSDSKSPYVNNCHVDTELELLTHMMQQTPAAPSNEASGTLYSFSQDALSQSLFNSAAGSFSMDSTGYYYVPVTCAQAGANCDLFVVLHGCLQGFGQIGTEFIEKNNLNVYADTNDYILLYPQAIEDSMLENGSGCWDWWGYTTSTSSSSTLYATHGAPQMEIIRAAMKSIGFKGKPKAQNTAIEVATA